MEVGKLPHSLGQDRGFEGLAADDDGSVLESLADVDGTVAVGVGAGSGPGVDAGADADAEFEVDTTDK